MMPTLRKAIIDLNANMDVNNTITFQAGLNGTINLQTALDALSANVANKNVTIEGPGANVITVRRSATAMGNFRILEINSGMTATVKNLTLSHGVAPGPVANGGGIKNEGSLTLEGVTLSNNTAGGAASHGGGIFNAGSLTLVNSSIRNNVATAFGGGIHNHLTGSVVDTNSFIHGNMASFGGGVNNAGSLNLTQTWVIGNTATKSGGGIYNDAAQTLKDVRINGNVASEEDGGGIRNVGSQTVKDTEISGNSAEKKGGGISNDGTQLFTNVTISGNSAKEKGGGIYQNGVTNPLSKNLTITNNRAKVDPNGDPKSGPLGGSVGMGGGVYVEDGATFPVVNTIIAGNDANMYRDVRGQLNSYGHNLIGDGTGGSGFHATDMYGTFTDPINARLRPLQFNGGPTQTHLLEFDSLALDAGNNFYVIGIPYDQRGIGFPRVVNDFVDIGAVEMQLIELSLASRPRRARR